MPMLLHVVVWAFLFLFPVFSNDVTTEQLIYRHWFPLFVSLFLFYLNFMVLIPKFYFNGSYLIFIGVNLLVIIAGLYFSREVFELLRPITVRPPHPHPNPSKHGLNIFWYKNLVSYVLAVGASIAVRMTAKASEEQNARKEAETEHLRSELSSLKYQIQPHFFFNTLNSIYSLIDINKEEAKEVLLQLSKLMRYVLYTGNQNYVDLESEINFLRSYADLMKVRLSDELNYSFEVEGELKGKIPPLLFISLVENAFKHGVDSRQRSMIDVRVKVDGRRATLEVKNSFYPKTSSDESGSGIGITNMEKRLRMLYPDHDFQFIHELRGEQYFASLQIPME